MFIRFAAAFLVFLSLDSLQADQMSAVMMPSTESDPDAFIDHSANVINGDYCETVLDLEIAGPDVLSLQRYYNAKNYMTGKDFGGWRIFPQILLVTGRDPQNKECKVGADRFEWIYAFAGERSGGILSYSGWRKIGGDTKDPLKIGLLKDTIGMVNSYAGEMNGQTNHLNNGMHFKQDRCELTLGDGTKRLYQKVSAVPTEIFGEEIALTLASKITHPQYFLLLSETLPSGNMILFSYDEKRRIISIEMKDASQKKSHSWIRFTYDFMPKGCRITATTSDEKTLNYDFERLQVGKQSLFVLKDVKGSYGMPISYDYEVKGNTCFLTKKRLPEGRFLEIEYDEVGHVKTFKSPSATSGKPEIVRHFVYGDKFTDVTDAANIKTRYHYDNRCQLVAIERYDQDGLLYRTDKKYYGKTRQDLTFLLARTISDGIGRVHSYRCFMYDGRGNVIEEKLYGNLTGKQEASLQIHADGMIINPDNEECHVKKFGYSEDEFNLVTLLGDCKGNKTTFHYQKGTNHLIRKFIYDKNRVKKSELRFYNSDGICIKIIEDDGHRNNVDELSASDVTERHIKEIHPKETLPGVGLPEIIEEKAYDFESKKEILIRKLENAYSPQGHLLPCATYDSDGNFAYSVSKTYNHLGQVTTETDPEGKTISYSYDGLGNQVLVSIPHQNKTIEKRYNFRNNLTVTTESTDNHQKILQDAYDYLGRKIASTDQFGQTTYFEYNAFGHLTKITYPTVLNEYEKPIQPIFTYTYDIFGNVLSITDPKGHTTHKTYNLRGKPTKIHYPDGSVEMFKYDTEGSLHRSLTRGQIITVYEYDYLGRVSYEEDSFVREKYEEPFITGQEYKYNGFRILSLRNRYLGNDTLTVYRHDPAGRVTAIVQYPYDEDEDHPESRKTEIFFDTLGREHKKRAWFDFGPADYSVECFEYDLLGNVIEKRVEDAADNILLRKGFAYDDAGRCAEEYTLLNGQRQTIVKTAYDSFGEPILFIDALGNETKVLIDYGKNSLRKTIINPNGVQTTLDFDALGRTVSINKKDSKGNILSSQCIFYDGVGNKSSEVHAIIADGKQIGIQKTRWVYGPMGRVEELIEAEGTPEEKRTTYSYNSYGQLTAKTLPGASAPLTYSYNKSGWLAKVHYQEGKNNPLLSNSYTYDRRGNITSAAALNKKSVERTYNIYDQILQETVDDGKEEYTLTYQYDRKGRLSSITLPDESAIAYKYDGVFGREVKRLSSRGEELYTHSYGLYDESGRLLEETLIGYCGDRRTHYDLNGRKTLIETDYYTETVPEKGYSPTGNLLTIQRNGDFRTENGTYTYNALSQLTSEKNGIYNTYSYDSIANRLKENKDKLIYNSLNQLVAKAKAEYAYDPQGNLLRKTLDGEETKFESDIFSQLSSIEQSNKKFLTFSYDPFGRRLAKKTYDSKEKNRKNISSTRSFYLGYHELGILDEKGTIKKLRIPGLSGNKISLKSIAIEIGNQFYAVLHDISGNVVALLDPASRDIIESYTYSAFGTEKIYDAFQNQIYSSAIGNPWRYAEKPIDEETGLIYFGFRYYDPSIGRWISKDPAGFVDGPNLYAYCRNNPFTYSDSFGLATVNEEEFYGEVENHCFCERHRTCKRGGDIGKTNGSRLPTIQYCDDFEQMYPNYESSKLFDLGFKEAENIGIGFINGVWNDFDDAYSNAQYVSKLADGYNIHAVYNATHGRSPDLNESRMGLNYVATEPVRLLHKMWNSYFEKSSADAKFLMVCHSQGAIHVRNALLDYPPELRNRITVVAIAPGAYVYRKTCAHVTHYCNASIKRDFIPHIDKSGSERERDTIINLISHPEATFFDHEFQSLTYQDALIRRLNEFFKR